MKKSSTSEHKLGLASLTAVGVGTMIGGGIFALPQNLAAHSSAGAIIIAWIITGIGMLALALLFRYLSRTQPQLQDGIYSYAKTGFGSYMGFNSAWGYWVSAWIGNVSYAVLLFSALGYFFPIFANGNTPYAILGASIFLWFYHFLILKGVKQAAFINLLATIAKLVPIALFIVLVSLCFKLANFSLDFWGSSLGSIFTQVKSTMLITVWVFIGIEGAVVESSRAKDKNNVGRATVIGFLITLALYVLISLLSFGIVPQAELAKASNPSMAFVLQHAVGEWGALVVNIGLIISLAGAWLGWTLLCVQLPYDAALDGAMPRLFAKNNRYQSPKNALWLTSLLIQFFLIVVLFSQGTYLSLVKLATSCILIPYFLSALFGLKHSIQQKKFNLIAIVATLYTLWLLYAAGIHYLLESFILYAIGIVFFYWAQRERSVKFTRIEKGIAIIIFLLAILALCLH